MKSLAIISGLLLSSVAFADSIEAIALERLSYEIASADKAEDKLGSLAAYFDTLGRVGASAKSQSGCVKSVLFGKVSGLCAVGGVQARSGGAGTGGAD